MIMFRHRKFWISMLVLAGLAVVQAPAQQAPAQQPPAQQPATPGPVLNLQDASLTEVVDQLARQLKINIQIDPRVKGTVTLNTYGETRNLDPRNLLDLILRVNGFGMVQEGEIYRIVPMADAVRQPIPFQVNGRDIPADEQLMLNLVFLKYVTVEELSKVLQEFTDPTAVLKVYPPANLLFILDSRRNMRRLMELVALFDSDTFAGERVRLYELHNARPSDLVKELDNILKSISLDSKNSTVRFLPVDRIGTLIAVAPNPGVFDTVETWIKKLDVEVSSTSSVIDTYVYHVRYGRADCLAMALNQLYMPAGSGGYGYGGGYGGGSPYGGGYGGAAYGGGYGGGGGGGYGGGGQIGGFGGTTQRVRQPEQLQQRIRRRGSGSRGGTMGGVGGGGYGGYGVSFVRRLCGANAGGSATGPLGAVASCSCCSRRLRKRPSYSLAEPAARIVANPLG